MDTVNRFPIRVLSEKTNVGSSTLRAWERRYGLLVPERTPKGHRLYNYSDIKKVKRILELLDDGHTLSVIKEIIISEKDLLQQSMPKIKQRSDTEITTNKLDSSLAIQESFNIWEQYKQKMFQNINDLSIERTDQLFNEASSLYPIDMVINKLIEPLLIQVGELWKSQPESGVAIEHFFTSWLRTRIFSRFHHSYQQARGKKIICSCVPGCYHEVGLMLFALTALSRGYRVLYFGADLPLNQLAFIQQRSAADGIVLSVHKTIGSGVEDELARLIPQIPIPIFIGGSNEQFNYHQSEDQGAILLGHQVSVAIKVIESHLPVYSGKTHKHIVN